MAWRRIMERFNTAVTPLLLGVILFMLILIFTAKEPTVENNQKQFEQRLNTLQAEKDSLVNAIHNSMEEIHKYEKAIDSLESLKSKISYVYVTKYKEVEVSSAVGVADKFADVFAKNGIR
jgi:hypothetical protein